MGTKARVGRKLHLASLFDAWAEKFNTARADVYDKEETIRYLTLELLWKPVKAMIRFILIENSRGRIVPMTSELTLQPPAAPRLCDQRVSTGESTTAKHDL